jgi:hypothetical protein
LTASLEDAPGRVGAESWEEFRARVVACGVEEYLRGECVSLTCGAWRVTVDSNVVTAGGAGVAVTRMRAPFVGLDGFRFKLHRRGLLDALGRLCGIHTSETGESDFDRGFHIETNDEPKLKRLFADGEIRRLVSAQREMNLEVRGGDGPLGARLPEGVCQLCFRAPGFVSDPERLARLFALFALTLERLRALGSAAECGPEVSL